MVQVHWEIDYDGPRPPLTIFKPSMGLGRHERTCLGFHYELERGHRRADVYV